MPVYRITIESSFNASHALRLPDGSFEPVHHHRWPVCVTVQSRKLDEMDCVMDFHELEKVVAQVLSPWQDQHLNDVPPFSSKGINPSAEQVAEQIALAVLPQLPADAGLVEVRVGEAEGCTAIYLPDH